MPCCSAAARVARTSRWASRLPAAARACGRVIDSPRAFAAATSAVAISAVVVPVGSSGVAARSGVRPSSASRSPCRAASARAESAVTPRAPPVTMTTPPGATLIVSAGTSETAVSATTRRVPSLRNATSMPLPPASNSWVSRVASRVSRSMARTEALGHSHAAVLTRLATPTGTSAPAKRAPVDCTVTSSRDRELLLATLRAAWNARTCMSTQSCGVLAGPSAASEMTAAASAGTSSTVRALMPWAVITRSRSSAKAGSSRVMMTSPSRRPAIVNPLGGISVSVASVETRPADG